MEVALGEQVLIQALFQFRHHLVRLSLQLLSAVLGQLCYRRLGGIPVVRPVLIEVGRSAGHAAKRIAEYRRRFAGHHAAELHAPVLDPLVRCRRGRRRTHVDGAGHSTTGRELAEVGQFAIELERQRVRPIDILLNHWHPVVREIARQFGLHAWVVNCHVGGQYQRVAVAFLP